MTSGAHHVGVGQNFAPGDPWPFWVDEEDDRLLGTGTLVVSAPRAVPEPATLSLTVFGLAGAFARARRARRSAKVS